MVHPRTAQSLVVSSDGDPDGVREQEVNFARIEKLELVFVRTR
jgi:hypothetical protein